MIYITGDTHGALDIGKLNTKKFPEQKQMTKDDFVIVCGTSDCHGEGNIPARTGTGSSGLRTSRSRRCMWTGTTRTTTCWKHIRSKNGKADGSRS